MWGFVRMPFFALVIFMLWLVSPDEPLSFLQAATATVIVLLAREYLNWVERKEALREGK
jgi:Na+-driven multidrug efflux pump